MLPEFEDRLVKAFEEIGVALTRIATAFEGHIAVEREALSAGVRLTERGMQILDEEDERLRGS